MDIFSGVYQIQKYYTKLKKMLNQCLDFSFLIDDFADVKAQKKILNFQVYFE